MSSSLEFCPTLDQLYRTGKAVDDAGIVKTANGLSTQNNLLIIRKVMMLLRPTSTIEIGLAAGASALTFAASHRDSGSPPAAQHVAIDPYQGAFGHLGKTLLKRAGLEPFTQVIEEPSCLALPDLMREGRSFGLAYIDGSHAVQECMLDFYYLRHLLTMGGIVLLDDCASRGVREMVSFIRKEIVSFEEFDLSPFREDSLRYRAARVLRKAQCLAFKKVADPKKDESWQWE